MLYVVKEEMWTLWRKGEELKCLRSSGPLFVGDKKAAYEYAQKRASEFDLHDSEGEPDSPYWWGRNNDERENHRFVVEEPAVQGALSAAA